MTKRWVVLAAVAVGAGLAVSCSGPRLPATARGELLLTVDGKVRHGPFRLGRADLEALPRAAFRAVDPASGLEARYEGVALQPLFADALEAEPGADTILVRTEDKEALPLSPVLLRQYRPILADRIDGAPVAPQLAWPNVDQQGIRRDPRAALWWARKVVGLELMAWDKGWGRALRPPPGASDAARLGAGQFALRCTACHRLGKAGGERGPALDGAAARLGREGFVAAVRRHPLWQERLGTELAPGDDVAAQLHAFVEVVDLSGPSDEPAQPEPREPRGPGRGPSAP